MRSTNFVAAFLISAPQASCWFSTASTEPQTPGNFQGCRAWSGLLKDHVAALKESMDIFGSSRNYIVAVAFAAAALDDQASCLTAAVVEEAILTEVMALSLEALFAGENLLDLVDDSSSDEKFFVYPYRGAGELYFARTMHFAERKKMVEEEWHQARRHSKEVCEKVMDLVSKEHVA